MAEPASVEISQASRDAALSLTGVLQHVDDPSTRIVLRPPRVLVGRGVNGPNDIPIPAHDTNASRQHVRLRYEDGVWQLEDLSLNGTRVNGRRVRQERVVLADGDYIQIGKTFHFVFRNLEMTDLSKSRSWDADDTGDGELPEAPDDGAPRAGLWISPGARVFREGETLPARLSRTEQRLISHLAAHEGRVRDFAEVALAVWGEARTETAVTELVQRIWAKVERNPAAPRYLFLQPGTGVALFSQGL